MKNKKDNQSFKFSKKIVILCITFIILYTIVQVYMNYVTAIEISPTLTTCVYAFFGTELAAVAAIRIFDKESGITSSEDPEESEEEYFRLDE